MHVLHTLRRVLARLRFFLAVVGEGSLSRAALRLRMSQPALSRQMQALENEVGGRLFERSASGISLTGAGHGFAARVRRLLADYEAAATEVRRVARGEQTELRIGYLASAAQGFLHPALAALRRRHPEVKTTLLDLSPGEQITALQQGKIDVALIGQEGSVAARDFYTHRLATLSVLAVLPADHRLAARKRVRLAELRDEHFVSVPDDQMPGRDCWITKLCRQAGGFTPKFIQPGDSVAHLFSLVTSEGAVALVPAYLRDFPAAGVKMIPVADASATWDFLVVWQRGRTAGPVRSLVEALGSAAGEGKSEAFPASSTSVRAGKNPKKLAPAP